jgi:hypothetical protein
MNPPNLALLRSDLDHPPADRTAYIVRPTWNRARRELHWGDELVKRFRQPAPSQECVLAAFEEQGWPERIDDPLPRGGGLNAKQHLRDTVKNLNRHQRVKRILFEADGTGQGILWKLIGAEGGLAAPVLTPEDH